MRLSDLTLGTPPSGIRAVFNRIAESENVISFALGEPDYSTPVKFLEGISESMNQGKTHYTPNAGIMDLRVAIAESYGERGIDPRQVVVTAGATEALLLLFMTLLNRGDEVIVMEPYWPTYLGQIRAVGGVIRFVRTYEEDGFVVKKENIESAITDKTRMIILNSPANPTGAMISREELGAIAEIAVKHDLIVISDEVYKHIVFGRNEFHSIYDFPGMRERCVIVDSFSKAYAMTGWRIGYIVAPAGTAKALESMHEYGVSCISEPIQRAAIRALKCGREFVEEMRESFEKRRNLITEGISSIEGLRCLVPPATFYLYFNIEKTGMKSNDFVNMLLDEQSIALAPGTAFGQGQENYIRLSYANSEENIKTAIGRIDRFVHDHM